MEKLLNKLFNIFKKYFITGFLLILPLWITIYILWLIVGIIGGMLSPILKVIFLDKIPLFGIKILSFLLTLLVIWIFGIITANIIGKKLLSELEKIIKRVPIIKEVYNSAKQFIKLLSIRNVDFKHVVLIEFPRKGLFSFGFITNDKRIIVNGVPMVSVFYPTTPNPTTGFYMLVDENEIIYPDIKIEEAIKIIMSGGVLFLDKDIIINNSKKNGNLEKNNREEIKSIKTI